MKALKGYSIVEYEEPEAWKDRDGIILPSAGEMRDILRKQGSKTFDADSAPPDVYRFGKLVDGPELGIPTGTFVYFNRHDAEEFEVEKRTYFRINNLNALAFYVRPSEAS